MTTTRYAVVRKSDGKSLATGNGKIVWLTPIGKDLGFRHSKADLARLLPMVTEEVEVHENTYQSRPGPRLF